MISLKDYKKKQRPNNYVVNFISKLLESREAAQIYHWTVKGELGSHSTHVALETYYEKVIELIDELVETYTGQYALLEDFIITNEYKDKEVIDYFKEVANFITINRVCFSKEDTHLHNIVDEITSLIYRTLYKLKYNK